jgi:PadR family transcriptional regulator PadR
LRNRLMKIERELIRGAGPIAVMRLLSGGEKYGYELIRSLSESSGGILKMGQSTLYPMLYNLEARGWVSSRLDETGARPRRYYSLTGKGRAKLEADLCQWRALVKAMEAIDSGMDDGLTVKGGVA